MRYTLLVLLLAAPSLTPAKAGILLSITETPSLCCGGGFTLYDRVVDGANWTQDVYTSQTEIDAAVKGSLHDAIGTAYLMRLLGALVMPPPGSAVPFTPVAEEIATTQFTAPQGVPYNTLVPIFTGLTLTPGTYFLILNVPEPLSNIGGGTVAATWTWDDLPVFTTAGFSVGLPMQAAYPNVAAYPPDSLFYVSSFGHLSFQLEGIPAADVPEVGSLGLTLVGGLAAASYFFGRRLC